MDGSHITYDGVINQLVQVTISIVLRKNSLKVKPLPRPPLIFQILIYVGLLK